MRRSPVGRHPSAGPPDPPVALGPTIVALTPGVELLGEYLGSGSTSRAYLVRRPDGRMLRISPLLYVVVTCIDGRRDLDEIARRVAADLDRSVSAAAVAYLIERKLRPLGVIEADAEADADPGPARAVGPALGLAVRAAVVPPRAVRAATAVLRPLFLPPVVGAALVGWVVVDALLLLGGEVARGLHGVVLTPALLLAVLGVTLAGALFHELGHATASRYGGAEPGVIGVGIYLLWPVFYNDLTDVYRLNRRGRLRADLGGLYFNVLVVLMLAGWYVVARWPPLLVAAVFQHLAMAQQLLPFVRLDGYYVLSDLIGVPDLFARIRPILSSVVPGRRRRNEADELRPGARAIVTAWVVVTVPVLAGFLVLAAVTLPSILARSGDALGMDAGQLLKAVRAGAPAAGLLSAVQLGVLAVPFVGVAVALVRAGRMGWRTVTRRLPTPGRPLTDDPPVMVGRRRLGPGGALVLVLLWAGTGPRLWRRARRSA